MYMYILAAVPLDSPHAIYLPHTESGHAQLYWETYPGPKV